LGVKSRQVSLLLYEKSDYLKGKDFIRWLSNLTSEEIETYKISKFDKENLKNVSLKLTPTSYREEVNEFKFIVKGTYFNEDWQDVSMDIELGDNLNYIRDEQNKYDPYAILILKEDKVFGYVPREYSKIIASEIDIDETEYEIIVENIIDKELYRQIQVRMTKSG
jgi:helicase